MALPNGTMFFMTCKPIKYRGDKDLLPRVFEFDTENTSPTREVFFCSIDVEDDHFIDPKEIGSLAFMQGAQKSSYEQVIFYIHGFNVQPIDALTQATVLQALFNAKRPNTCMVIPIIWPCGTKEGILRDYWDDQKSADMSGFAIGRAIGLFTKWQQQNRFYDVPCSKFINILTHSMGNRLLKEALYNWGHYDAGGKVPMLFRNIFMVAADVVYNTLEANQKGSFIPYAGKNVVVYYSGDDLALRGSKAINSDNFAMTKRLGHGGPSPASLNIQNVYGVDCDAVNSAYDPLLGHTYFIDKNELEEGTYKTITAKHGGKVFDHIFDCISTGVMNNKKSVLSKSGVRGFFYSLLDKIL